ncbi:GAF domain-containing protein [bacterium]|nr:GAF domain-containing protein [bacterium]
MSLSPTQYRPVNSRAVPDAMMSREVTALLRASRAVLQYAGFEESAHVIFLEAKKITGARSGYVALLSEDGSENEILFLDAGGLPCTVDENLPMPIRGLRELAYRNGETVYNNDFMHSEWVDYMPDGHVELRNVMFAPLIIDNKTVGIMGLANKDGDFTDDDARMAAAFGEFASVALHNSRMVDNLRDTVRDLKATLDEVHTLRGIIPICSRCKKIRNDEGYYQELETYLLQHSDVMFTHGLCEECVKYYDDDDTDLG